MAITKNDVIYVKLNNEEIGELILQANEIAKSIIDRNDLHERDHLERVINVALGEIAEKMVIMWLTKNRKTVRSASDKASGKPDMGHDVVVKRLDGRELLCSIKSSLSVYKDVEGIINEFTLATKKSELRDINIQVYFWLKLSGTSARVTVPSTNNAAIIGWFGNKDLKAGHFSTYSTEERQAPSIKLSEARSMNELLNYLQ
jgi:hypothetical protein